VWYNPQPKQRPKRLPRRYPLKTIPSGLGDKNIVGNWLFYYLKGGDHLHDFSPYKNHGDIKGAKWVDGRYGWALDFDGVDDIVDMGQPSVLTSSGLGDSLTLTCWIKSTQAATASKSYVGMREEDSNDIYGFVEDRGAILPYFYIDATGGDVKAYLSSHFILDGNWHLLTGVYNGSDVLFYVDGELKASETTSGELDSVTDAHFTVGSRYHADGDPTQNYAGKIDEVRIYNRALSSSEIQAYYNRTKGVFGL